MDITLQGFATAQEANEVGELVGGWLNLVAEELSLNLSRLDGVTVAHDYDNALAQLRIPLRAAAHENE